MSGAGRFDVGLGAADLAIARGGRVVLDGVSFELAPGETLLLKGPNGGGKTSLLRTLAGLLAPASGAVRLSGERAADSELRAAAVYAGHADGVKATMTGAEHLRFWGRLYDGGATRINEAVAALDLGAFVGERASAMSAGQRRRLSLSRVVISGKSIWLLDEPTAAMDAAASARLVTLIEAHNKAGGAAIIATHDKLAITGRTLLIEAAWAAA